MITATGGVQSKLTEIGTARSVLTVKARRCYRRRMAEAA